MFLINRLNCHVVALLVLVLLPVSAFSSPLLIQTLSTLRDAKMIGLDGVQLLSGRLLADFYERRGNQLVWTDPKRINALLELAEDSRAEGFVPEDFHAETLRLLAAPQVLTTLSESDRIAADLKISDALLRYVHHTRFGKLDPITVDPKYHDRPPIPEAKLLDDMMGALDADDVKAFLNSRIERPFWYLALRQALSRYSSTAHLEGLSPLPGGAALAQGNRHPHVALLRERLRALGEYTPSVIKDANLFDAQLHADVMRFQQRFGLSPDGVVGAATLAALNQSYDPKKVEQIRINLERMRWFYADLPPDYVFVDVADYRVHVVRDGAISWTTRVIVGEKDSQTPMFRDTMDHLVLNPTWIVPISIQKTMGQVSAHYAVVDRQTGHKFQGGDASNYKRYQIVQEPGPKNALGRVKFMFPNRHSVYLHDTPNKGLFARSSRALSHGCVRVQDPVKLAEILLDGSGWDRTRIDQVIEEGRTRYVNLAQGLPVLIYYLTAVADQQGKVNFRQDFYDRDPRLIEMFAAPVLHARIAFPETPEPTVLESEAPTAPAEPESEIPNDSAPTNQDRVRLTETVG